MANLGNIVYLSEAQKDALFANGTVTANGTTVTYNPNDLYVTPEVYSDTNVSSYHANIDTADGNTLITCHRAGSVCFIKILSLHVSTAIAASGSTVIFTLPSECAPVDDNYQFVITKAGTYESTLAYAKADGTVTVPAGLPAGWYAGGGVIPLL